MVSSRKTSPARGRRPQLPDCTHTALFHGRALGVSWGPGSLLSVMGMCCAHRMLLLPRHEKCHTEWLWDSLLVPEQLGSAQDAVVTHWPFAGKWGHVSSVPLGCDGGSSMHGRMKRGAS